MKRAIKHALAALLALCLLLSAVPALAADADAAFDAFLTEWWREEMEQDYVTMHLSVKDYGAYGIEKPAPELPHVSYELCFEASAAAAELLERLAAFDYGSLSRERQRDYDAVGFYLEYARDVDLYPQFQELFNPYTLGLNGVVSNYFAEFVFYGKEDFPDYLSLLESFPRFVDEAVAMTERQAAQGYFMPDSTLDTALEDIARFVAMGEDNMLIAIFERKADAFPGLTDAERAEYKEKNRALVAEAVFPAYEKAAAALEALRGSRAYDGGLCNFPDGDKYYEAVLRWKTGTRLGPDEILDACAQVAGAYRGLYLADVYVNGVGAGGKIKLAPDQIGMAGPEEILDYLRGHMDAFPAGPDVSYEVSYLDPSMESPGTAAYYMPTPLDDVTDNVIRVNGSYVGADDADELFATLAHEGFPGHLYQYTWYLSTDPNPARAATGNLGYEEGWAQYAAVEMVLDALGLDDFSTLYTAISRYCGYALYGEADVVIQAKGGTAADLANTTLGAMITDAGTLMAAYDQLVSMPGAYLPYSYGAIRFEALRNKADRALGDALDVAAFHEVLLTGGPRPFETVERDVDDFILAAGGTVPGAEGALPYPREFLAMLDSYENVAAGNKFKDVAWTDWYCAAVGWAARNGVTAGVYDDGQVRRFGPDETATLGHAVTFLSRMAGAETADGGAWYDGAMRWAFSLGLPDGGDPGGAISRADMAKLLYAYARSLGQGFEGLWAFSLADAYADADEIPEDAYEAACWLTMQGVVKGKDGAFDPAGRLTRAEAVTLLYRLDAVLTGAGTPAA